jgi:hypothetical protein
MGLSVAAGEPAAGVIPSHIAALAAGVTRAMSTSKFNIVAAVLLAVGLVAGSAGMLAHQALAAREPPVGSPQSDAANPEPEPAAPIGTRSPDCAPAGTADDKDAVAYGGRVLGPDGRPIPDAKLYLTLSWSYVVRPAPSAVYATTGADGRFAFMAPKALFDDQVTVVAATAANHGVAWIEVPPSDKKDDLTLQLANDDVPITGQIVDLEGKAVRGATLRVQQILAADKDNLGPWLEAVKGKKGPSYQLEHQHFPRQLLSQEVPGLAGKVTTDAEGRFRLSGIGRDRLVVVRLDGPAIASQELRILTRAGETLKVLETEASADYGTPRLDTAYCGAVCKHVAGATRPIVGLVRDRDTKKPLPGVTIKSYKLAHNPVHGLDFIQTTTDEQGRYRLNGMPKGNDNKIMLVPRADQPYLTVHAVVPGGDGLDPVTVDFDLKRGIWIEGKLTDKTTGKPLQGVIQYLAVGDNPHVREHPGYEGTYTNPVWNVGKDGSYRVIGLPGPGILAAQYGDHYLLANERDDAEGAKELFLYTIPGVAAISYNGFRRIDPPKDAEKVQGDVTLDPGQSFTGTVVGPDDKPLVGVRTFGLSGWAGWEGMPLKTATFTVWAFNPRRPRPVLFRHLDKGLVGVLEPPQDASLPVLVRLQPGATVSGRLVAADGRPRANVELDVLIRSPGAWDGYSLPNKIRTDSAGLFRIEAMLPGYQYEVYDRQGSFQFGDGLRSGETKELGDVQMKRAGE